MLFPLIGGYLGLLGWVTPTKLSQTWRTFGESLDTILLGEVVKYHRPNRGFSKISL